MIGTPNGAALWGAVPTILSHFPGARDNVFTGPGGELEGTEHPWGRGFSLNYPLLAGRVVDEWSLGMVLIHRGAILV